MIALSRHWSLIEKAGCQVETLMKRSALLGKTLLTWWRASAQKTQSFPVTRNKRGTVGVTVGRRGQAKSEKGMSELDRNMLSEAGLSASKVATLMGKSRQAVSRGVASSDDYFSTSDLLWITERVREEMPDQSARVQNAFSAMFQRLADRLGASVTSRMDLEASIAQAERVWLIFPDYPVSFVEQRDAYFSVFNAIDERRPSSDMSEHVLEVVVFCDRGRPDIESQFHESWHELKRMAMVQCALVGKMLMPIVVVDPHLDQARTCHALSAEGFVPLAPATARSRVSEFAEEVGEKIRCASAAASAKRLNLLTASPALLLETGAERV